MDLKKMDPQDVVEMNRLLGLFNEIDPAELQKVADSALTPMEKMAEDLKKSQAVTRRVKGAQLKRKKLHWKTKAKRQREYYQKHTKHKRVIKKGELLSTGAEGWWEHIRGHWYQKGYEVDLTIEEWKETVWPALEGRVPVIRRYNTNAPVSLENIYVVESGTQNNVLFDGKEHKLRQLGYII